MSPGPKRRGKKDFSDQRSSVRQDHACPPKLLNDDEVAVNKQNAANIGSLKSSEESANYGDVKNNYQKYSKRQVQSNWDRYEERTPGLMDDTLRGESFEVLASYQGGSDSYLKLKEEKEWGDTKDLDDGLFIDCDALAQSLKCIPLHKRLHISDDCFTPEMIQKFDEAAERSSSWKLNAPLTFPSVKDDLPAFGTFSNVEDVSMEVTYKPKVISDKTTKIILSLTSCSDPPNDETPKMLPEVEETPPLLTSNDVHHDAPSKPEVPHDDLAFLLSLSGSDKHSLDAVEEKGPNTSIEDWLNELLEK